MKILIVLLFVFSFLSCKKSEFGNTTRPQLQYNAPTAKVFVYTSAFFQKEWVYDLGTFIKNKKLPFREYFLSHCDSLPITDVADLTVWEMYKLTVKRPPQDDSKDYIDPFAKTTYIQAKKDECLYIDVSKFW